MRGELVDPSIATRMAEPHGSPLRPRHAGRGLQNVGTARPASQGPTAAECRCCPFRPIQLKGYEEAVARVLMKASRIKTPAGDLRRSRRLAIDRLVTVQLVASRVPIKICDISSGGFAMETSSPVLTGEVISFRFTSKDGSSFLLRATVAHCRRMPYSHGPACYLSGLEFAAQQTPTGQLAIKVLLEKVSHVLAFPRSLSA